MDPSPTIPCYTCCSRQQNQHTDKNPGMQGKPIHHMSSIAISSANPNKSMKVEDEGIVDHDELLT